MAARETTHHRAQDRSAAWMRGALVVKSGRVVRGRHEHPSRLRRGGHYDFMRSVLNRSDGRALYKQRQAIIEPVFSQTKITRRADRFQRRGLAACKAEWRLITATHNLLKLWRTGLATAEASGPPSAPDHHPAGPATQPTAPTFAQHAPCKAKVARWAAGPSEVWTESSRTLMQPGAEGFAIRRAPLAASTRGGGGS
jgi:Transposase DDE domain